MDWLTHSACPSVSGWLVVLSFSCVPVARKTDCQKLLVKTGSLSETSDNGMLCKRQILSTKISATLLAVYGWEGNEVGVLRELVDDHQQAFVVA